METDNPGGWNESRQGEDDQLDGPMRCLEVESHQSSVNDKSERHHGSDW